MKLLRRLIAWSCVAGLLIAVGVAVYHWVRHTPRYVASGRLTIEHLSADGRWLIASVPHRDFNYYDNVEAPEAERNNSGFLQVWNLHRQCLEREFEVGLPVEKSADGHLFIGCRQKGKLLVIDWQAGIVCEAAWDT